MSQAVTNWCGNQKETYFCSSHIYGFNTFVECTEIRYIYLYELYDSPCVLRPLIKLDYVQYTGTSNCLCF